MFNKLYRNGQLIDLHIHTQYSDGMYTVKELLRFAELRGLDVLSFTDHDLLDANFELREMGKGTSKNCFCGKIINGCEIAVIFEGNKYEILAYDFDLDTLAKWDVLNLDYQFALEEKRIETLKENATRLGFKFTEGLQFDPIYRTAHKTFFYDLVKYPQNQAMFQHFGIGTGDNFYRDHVVKPGSLFYCYDIINQTPSIEEACNRVHEAGGICSFAHPFNVYNVGNPKELIRDVNKLDILDGFECIHKKFSLAECEWMSDFCDKNRLIKTGGSDFHGDGFKINGKRFAPEYLGYVQNANLEVRFPLKKQM